MCKIKLNQLKILELGNLNAKRDWGHAKDYVEAMWLMLQKKNPDDYVIATGKQYSVKDFINIAAKKLNLPIIWRGKGVNEVGINKITNKVIIKVNKKYFRPTEVESLLGDPKKARRELKWKPKISFQNLVDEMVSVDLKNLKDS